MCMCVVTSHPESPLQVVEGALLPQLGVHQAHVGGLGLLHVGQGLPDALVDAMVLRLQLGADLGGQVVEVLEREEELLGEREHGQLAHLLATGQAGAVGLDGRPPHEAVEVDGHGSVADLVDALASLDVVPGRAAGVGGRPLKLALELTVGLAVNLNM